jgi:hypothetical protein|tara:strand:- start:15123 stop:15398 length:276 start_codon:yes stop_codon:yes gene_type:complete
MIYMSTNPVVCTTQLLANKRLRRATGEDDLAYCGPESEEQELTIEENTLKYKTECRICPQRDCDTIAYLKENTDVELTCWYPYGQQIIDDP